MRTPLLVCSLRCWLEAKKNGIRLVKLSFINKNLKRMLGSSETLVTFSETEIITNLMIKVKELNFEKYFAKNIYKVIKFP